MNLILKNIFILSLLTSTFLTNKLVAQNPGDTIRVKTFHYGTNNRDTIAHFPTGNTSFEKIILRYNLRCKNGLVSDASNRNKGCGEWDYSCNTFVVDSTKVELLTKTAPKFIVSNFTGNSFKFKRKQISDYYDFVQKNVTVSSTANESLFSIGNGNLSINNALNTSQQSGKTAILFRAGELIASGFTAGNIDGISLNAISGGTANFFKVNIKQTTSNQLNAAAPEIIGFTEAYNNTYSFTKGSNKIIFHTPFAWDGTSNLIFEFSFTNSSTNTGVVFEGYSDTTTCMLVANNNYALDLSSNGHVVLDATNLTSIKNEISIAFWAFGDPKSLPTNTSVIYGWASDPNQRQLNIHFPWSDGSIYFDCGYTSGGYDRINKAATTSDYEGKWNHWVFTKNATTGNMSVYLNGTLWLSGTSKSKTMSLMNVILGKDQSLQNNYKGKINELSIWNKALTASEVKDWMNRSIDNSHPQIGSLLAYYPMNEGAGLNITDQVKNVVSKGKNVQWTFERGDGLNRMFQPSSQKPNLTLIRANITKTVSNFVQRDSILRLPNMIERYKVIDNGNSNVVTHDALVVDSMFIAFEASKSKVYDGSTGLLMDSIDNKEDAVLTIPSLTYYQRFPWYNELMSFVTPYGLGLDLGMKGKDWFFDMSDFAPLLKGNKRIAVTMGGQNQEQMELEFLFIVGTPARPVLEYNQIWQGAARLGGPGIGSILNNSVFPPMNVKLPSAAKSFKMRSTITGHGSDGEFEQNGGSITHSLNIAGKSMNWSSVVDCSVNPMIAQGGTWLIPRQGWCPGLRSKLIEHDITSIVKAGNTESFDYEISQPDKSGGDYRYLVAHQLISYGDPSFNLDARIVNVLKPTTDFEYAKSNPICSQPVVLVQNTGKETLKTIKFEYWANNAAEKQVWTWAGNLAYMDTVSITLPTWSLWDIGMIATNNVFHCNIKEVNGQVDPYSQNSNVSSPVTIPDVIPGNFKIEFRTNNNPTENAITLYDVDGKVVMHDTFITPNKLTTYNFNLNGCYKLVVNDFGLDGLNWWANTAQGTGFVRLRNGISNSIVKTFNADFGSIIEYNFTTSYALNQKELAFDHSVNVYPNPTEGMFFVEGSNLENANIEVFDLLGNKMVALYSINEQRTQIHAENWAAGVYFVVISKGNLKSTKKIILK